MCVSRIILLQGPRWCQCVFLASQRIYRTYDAYTMLLSYYAHTHTHPSSPYYSHATAYLLLTACKMNGWLYTYSTDIMARTMGDANDGDLAFAMYVHITSGAFEFSFDSECRPMPRFTHPKNGHSLSAGCPRTKHFLATLFEM